MFCIPAIYGYNTNNSELSEYQKIVKMAAQGFGVSEAYSEKLFRTEAGRIVNDNLLQLNRISTSYQEDLKKLFSTQAPNISTLEDYLDKEKLKKSIALFKELKKLTINFCNDVNTTNDIYNKKLEDYRYKNSSTTIEADESLRNFRNINEVNITQMEELKDLSNKYCDAGTDYYSFLLNNRKKAKIVNGKLHFKYENLISKHNTLSKNFLDYQKRVSDLTNNIFNYSKAKVDSYRENNNQIASTVSTQVKNQRIPIQFENSSEVSKENKDKSISQGSPLIRCIFGGLTIVLLGWVYFLIVIYSNKTFDIPTIGRDPITIKAILDSLSIIIVGGSLIVPLFMGAIWFFNTNIGHNIGEIILTPIWWLKYALSPYDGG